MKEAAYAPAADESATRGVSPQGGAPPINSRTVTIFITGGGPRDVTSQPAKTKTQSWHRNIAF